MFLAYMGLGSGLDFLPYFAALLSLVGAALVALVQRPFFIVLRWLTGRRKQAKQETAAEATRPPHDL